MQNRFLLSILFTLATFSIGNSGEVVDYKLEYGKCLKGFGITNNNSVMACSEGVGEEASREISAIYESLLLEFAQDETARQNFKKSHEAWILYRDLHCKLAGTYVGTPMFWYCPMNRNINRVLELRELSE